MNFKTPEKGSLLKRVTAFFVLPLLFCFTVYFIIYIIAGPIISPVSLILSTFVGDSVPNFDKQEVVDNHVDFVIHGAEQEEMIHVSEINMPKIGEKYAHITIPDTGVDCDIFYGDTKKILKKGPGQSTVSMLPGFGSTTLVGAHVTTHFKGLQHVKVGDIIYYSTSWGAYEYKITDIKVVKATEAESLVNLGATKDSLVLYTCYPFEDVTSRRKERYMVWADCVSGPKIDTKAKG